MSNEMALSAGYRLSTEVAERGQELRLHAPDGKICLKITLAPEGPLVELSSAALSVEAHGAVKVACESFEVAARKGVALRAGGDVTVDAEQAILTSAFEQAHVARRGDYRLKANDDVRVDGDRKSVV